MSYESHKTFSYGTAIYAFLPQDAIQARPCRHAVSVCVCLSCSWILSKRINISSKFFTVG